MVNALAAVEAAASLPLALSRALPACVPFLLPPSLSPPSPHLLCPCPPRAVASGRLIAALQSQFSSTTEVLPFKPPINSFAPRSPMPVAQCVATNHGSWYERAATLMHTGACLSRSSRTRDMRPCVPFSDRCKIFKDFIFGKLSLSALACSPGSGRCWL